MARAPKRLSARRADLSRKPASRHNDAINSCRRRKVWAERKMDRRPLNSRCYDLSLAIRGSSPIPHPAGSCRQLPRKKKFVIRSLDSDRQFQNKTPRRLYFHPLPETIGSTFPTTNSTPRKPSIFSPSSSHCQPARKRAAVRY